MTEDETYTVEEMWLALISKVQVELVLKGHAIVKVNDEQVCVVKNNTQPEGFYSKPLSDLIDMHVTNGNNTDTKA